MALHRKFDGKTYSFRAEYHNKERALARARSLREYGFMARVTQTDQLTWAVWVK